MSLRSLLAAALLACAALSSPAAADPPTPPAPEAQPGTAAGTPATAPDPDEKVCKVERELGSNKLKRICRTRAQIENDREAAREAMSREQQR